MEVIQDDGSKLLMTINTHQWVDPTKFTFQILPLAVVCADLRSLDGYLIRAHDKGDYNHAFIQDQPGSLVSQNFTGFARSPIEAYMKPGILLKFWKIKDITDDEKDMIYSAIAARLALPGWRRSYDFLGVFIGQLFHLKWLQNPFQFFCSEQVWRDFVMSIKRILKILGTNTEPNPSELNAIFVAHPEVMECVGYWWDF